MRKHVFFIGTRFYGVHGPCRLIFEKLLSRGYSITVFAAKDQLRSSYPQVSSRVRSIPIPLKRSYTSVGSDLICIAIVFFYCIRFQPRSIHSFNPKPSMIATAVKIIWPWVDLFVGVTGLGNTFIRLGPKQRRFLYPFFSLQTRLCKYCFFQNSDDIELFSEKFSLEPQKTRFFPGPGVDVEKFHPKVAASTADFRRPLRIILVGRLLYQKGYRDFFNLYDSYSLRTDSRFSFTVCGSLDFEHPDKIDKYDFERYVSNGISWLEWVDDMESVYQDNDLLLFMSEREGGPRAVLEASCCGLPVIGSDVSGVSQFIKDGITGFIVSNGDAKSIFKYLEFYYYNRSSLVEHGVLASKFVKQSFSLELASDEQLKMYGSK